MLWILCACAAGSVVFDVALWRFGSWCLLVVMLIECVFVYVVFRLVVWLIVGVCVGWFVCGIFADFGCVFGGLLLV